MGESEKLRLNLSMSLYIEISGAKLCNRIFIRSKVINSNERLSEVGTNSWYPVSVSVPYLEEMGLYVCALLILAAPNRRIKPYIPI